MKIKFLTIVAAVALFSCEAATDAAEGAVEDGTQTVEEVEGAEDKANDTTAAKAIDTTAAKANDTTAAKDEEVSHD